LFFKRKKKRKKKGRAKGWLGHPQPMGVAGDGAQPPLCPSFLKNKNKNKKIEKYIYLFFLINLYFFY